MIRDWGLWELTDEDWYGFVPVRDRQNSENATQVSQSQESLAPNPEGEIETETKDIPTLQPQQEELKPIRVTSPQVSQPLETSKPEAILDSVIPAVIKPKAIPQKTDFETGELREKERPETEEPKKVPSSESIPVTSPPELAIKTPSQPDLTQVSLSQMALQVGDWNITVEEIVPLLKKYQLLPKLVREIIIDRALIEIDCPSEELTQAVEEFYQQQKIASPQQLQAWLQQKQTNVEQIQNAIARSIKLDKFKEKMWGDRLETYFLERKSQLDKVLYSLLRTQDLGVAQELYFRILEEEAEFSYIAKEYSQGVEASKGGIVGPIALNKIHPTLKEMFQRSKPGQLWSPQYIDNWFVVVRLEQFVPAKLDGEIRQQILTEQFNQWMQEQYKQVVFQ